MTLIYLANQAKHDSKEPHHPNAKGEAKQEMMKNSCQLISYLAFKLPQG